MNIQDVKQYLSNNKIICDIYKSPWFEWGKYNIKIFLVDKKDPNFWKKRALPFSFWNNWNIDVYWVPVVKENMEFFKTNADYRKQAKSEFKKEMTKFKSFWYDENIIITLYKKILWENLYNILFI